MIDPGTAADLQRRQMEALRELPRVQAELAAAQHQLGLASYHLDDGGGHPYCGYPPEAVGGRRSTVYEGDVTCPACLTRLLAEARAELALLRLVTDAALEWCHAEDGSQRLWEECQKLRASGWQAPGEGEVGGMKAPDRWVDAYSGQPARSDQSAALDKRFAALQTGNACMHFHGLMWRPVWDTVMPLAPPAPAAREGEGEAGG